MQKTTLEKKTDYLLEQWARWAKCHTEHLDYPSATPYRKLMGSTVAMPLIDDEEAMAVDRAVAALLQRDPKAARAVIVYYWQGGNISRTARVLGICRNLCDTLIKSGTAWIDGHLNNEPLQPEMYQVQRLIEELSCQLGV